MKYLVLTLSIFLTTQTFAGTIYRGPAAEVTLGHDLSIGYDDPQFQKLITELGSGDPIEVQPKPQNPVFKTITDNDKGTGFNNKPKKSFKKRPKKTKPHWGTSCAGDGVSLNTFECKVLKLTNAERAKYGLKPLKISRVAYLTAKDHSRNMSTGRHGFTHTPGGRGPVKRARARGGNRRTHYGENIAAGHQTPRSVVRGWMNSRGHCAAILDSRNHSIGIARAGNYTTQIFEAAESDIWKTGRGRSFSYPSQKAFSRCR